MSEAADVKVWWKQAVRDLESAKNSFISVDYYVSAFLCQQSVEKALKYLYIREYTQLIRIHDLVKLARDVHAPLEVVQKCALINPVYVEVRYPEGNDLPSSKITKREAENILRLSEEVLSWVKKQ